ncbi:response regulator [Pigmentiphaga aceris]|uniref:histidine kinase n=1 Tax=Pigmentiphaga aceris TaxID=1940612 RepID=A0A5C0B339_9BURK|nr:ATP-binding protein [Pigmentiphaga aceris]QEI08324.1 response regulator [Pigmentiphaga aceris]
MTCPLTAKVKGELASRGSLVVAAYDIAVPVGTDDDRYRALLRALDDGFCVIEVILDDAQRGIDYRFVEVNAAFEQQTGLTNAIGKCMRDLAPDHETHWYETYGRVAVTGQTLRFEHRADALGRWYEVIAFRVGDPAARTVGVLFRDVRHRKAHEEEMQARVQARTAELEQAHAQLRHAQKMEVVGQLTGGIAHDFNNLLQGITGSLELIRRYIRQGRIDNLERLIEGAMGSAERAASLTHRLLAFSRRQPLDPRTIDANPLIASMEELLRRSLGSRINLEVHGAENLWLTLCDANQLESAILNLCINARDAMPEEGNLYISSSNVVLDAGEARRLGDIGPGQYVRIAVSDTGMGMSPDTVSKAFEPFFTTKPLGQGTGLGLSMIYGFARQSGGQVQIDSALGRGTTINLYLPRYIGEPSRCNRAVDTIEPTPASNELVLVVEDDDVIRSLIVETLSDQGYRICEAADGPAGLAVLQSRRDIDLLVTDIGLPGLNGRQVADAARLLRPGLRVMFMTGYAQSALSDSELLEPGVELITKPFAIDTFVRRIRGMLDA